MTPKDDINNVIKVIRESVTFDDALKKLGLTMTGTNNKWIREISEKYKVDTFGSNHYK